MAITDSYATATEYLAAIKKTATGDNTETTNDLTAVSRWIERETGRVFNVDAGDVTRVFNVGEGLSEAPLKAITRLWVPDLAADPTTIKIDEDDDGVFTDETALAATDYYLGPQNADVGPEPGPFEYIDLARWGTKNAWPYGHRVEIIGTWGFPSVPQAIKQATIQLTGILRLETPRGAGRIEDSIAGASLVAPKAQRIVSELAMTYRRVSWGG